MRRKKKRELCNITLNLDASIETARAGLSLIRDGPPVDREMAADYFESFIKAVDKQNARLRKAID